MHIDVVKQNLNTKYRHLRLVPLPTDFWVIDTWPGAEHPQGPYELQDAHSLCKSLNDFRQRSGSAVACRYRFVVVDSQGAAQ